MKTKEQAEQKRGEQPPAPIAAEKPRGGGYASGKSTETTKPKKTAKASTEKTRKPF